MCPSKLTSVSERQLLCARALWSGSLGLQIITSSLVLWRSTCAGLSVPEAVWVREAWSSVFTFLGLSRFYSAWKQVPASISHDEAGSDGGVGCRSITNPQLFSSKLRISQLLNLVPEFCFCVLTLYWGGKGRVWKDQVRSHLHGAVYAGHGPHACNSWGSRRRRSVSLTHKTLSGTARVWDVDQGRTSLLCAVLWIRCT